MNPDYWVLTEAEYFALVDQRTERLNRSLKERWRKAVPKKGATVNLLERDFPNEKREELDDHEAYDIMDEERDRRRKEALS